MIPKIIWQTYIHPINELPDYVIKNINSWKNINPDYEYRYMDDNEINNFVLKEFDREWYELFTQLPLGVMRADIWRYMVLYKYGGVYCDIDTICLQPISNWIILDMNMITCIENNHFCQWVFAAQPGNLILKEVLKTVINNIKHLNISNASDILSITGPIVFTNTINKIIYNLKNKKLDFDCFLFNSFAKPYKFYCYCGNTWWRFHKYYVKHEFSSISPDWENRWRDKCEILLNTKSLKG